MSTQFPKRRDKAAAEIREVVNRYQRGEPVHNDEIAGVLLEYHRTILVALERGLSYLACLRCGHRWPQRQEAAPKQCPRCHSPYWARPRKKKS